MTADGIPADLAAAISLGGDTGRLFAAFDWSSHPLGPLPGWPAERRATVAAALTSRFPIVLWLDPDELFLVYNDAYATVLGERHPGALGLPGREVWWDIWDSINPMLAGVVATGQATWSKDLRLPMVSAGQPQERYFTFSYGPMLAADGRVDGVFCAVSETTERVLGERRLHALNSVAAAVMETHTVQEAIRATTEACAQSHPDLPFVAVYVDEPGSGTSRLRGATPRAADLLPASLDALTSAREFAGTPLVVDGLPELVPSWSTRFGDDAAQRAVVLRVGTTGQDTVSGALVVGINPHRPLDDQYQAFCRLLADQVTATVATAGLYEQQLGRADALAELDRAKTEFLTNISHEFRTPLTLLLGPLADAIEDLADQPVQVERLDTARRNAHRLLRLVNTLLDFSRTEAGGATANLVTTDVGALTEHIAASFTELCQRAGIGLVLRCDAVLADIDPAMWETIVLNLLSNAVKFTLRGSIIVEVTALRTGSQVRVTDTGTGIAEADRERLFERFYRATNNRGRSVEGTGIGLALVRGLVESQHGSIDIDSEIDAGTTVTIRLPAATGRFSVEPAQPDLDNPYVSEALQWLDSSPSEPSAEPFAPGVREGHLVLVADDNADMRRHLDRILSTRWQTIVFGDGQTALEAARRYRPDIVVTDMMMPSLDGFGLVTAMRGDPDLATTPVVMLSARAGPEAADEGYAGGVDDYLAKPFTSQELVNRVAARLNGVTRERTRRAQDDETARRDAALAELEAALGTATSTNEALSALLASEVGALAAASAAIGTPGAGHGHIRINYAGTLRPELRDRYHLVAPDAPVPIVDVIRTGIPLIISDLAHVADDDYLPFARDAADSIGAMVVQPLHDDTGRTVGAIALMWPAPREFDTSELDLVAHTAGVVGSAINRIRAIEGEHRIATDFQDQLLDLDRGSTAAMIGAVYQPAGEAMRVGGDWYLVAPLDEPGRVAVCVGDVVGHGLPAATAMSKLRSAIAAAALTAPDPASVLRVVERYAAAVPGAACSTLAYAVADANTHSITYTCAGHPYPLVVTPAGEIRYLEEGRRPPLAAHSIASSDATAHAELPPCTLLLLYTDGLIERPGEPLTDGFDRLAGVAADCATLPVSALCTEVVTRMAPHGGYRDDVVLLALRAPGETATMLGAVLPARASEIPPLRHRLADWLDRQALDDQLALDVLLAVEEALSNAVEHGSELDPEKTVSLEVFGGPDTITATISDAGQWSTDSSASRRAAMRGRGLTLIYGLSERVDTVRSARGTQITLHFRKPDRADAVPATGATP